MCLSSSSSQRGLVSLERAAIHPAQPSKVVFEQQQQSSQEAVLSTYAFPRPPYFHWPR